MAREQRARLRVAIVGCGLIGGSLGLAIRRHWPKARVVGIDRPRVREAALAAGAITEGTTWTAGIKDLDAIDIILLACGPKAIIQSIARIKKITHRRQGATPLIIDVASIKSPIIEAATRLPHFVGGHPMAGHAGTGVGNASAALFENRTFVLCRAAETTPADVRAAKRLVEGLGARPRLLDALTHDRCVALISHLPHLLSLCLMDQGKELFGQRSLQGLPWALAAGSWRDATRVAMANPVLWNEIFATNRDCLIEVIEDLEARLGEAARALGRNRPPIPNIRDLARLRSKIAPKLPP